MNAHFWDFKTGFRVSTLVLLLTVSVGANDFLIMSGTPPAILRFNGATGASLGQFAAVSNGIAMTYGPDGNLYVATSRNVSRYDGQTGSLLNIFVAGTGNLLEP